MASRFAPLKPPVLPSRPHRNRSTYPIRPVSRTAAACCKQPATSEWLHAWRRKANRSCITLNPLRGRPTLVAPAGELLSAHPTPRQHPASAPSRPFASGASTVRSRARPKFPVHAPTQTLSSSRDTFHQQVLSAPRRAGAPRTFKTATQARPLDLS